MLVGVYKFKYIYIYINLYLLSGVWVKSARDVKNSN